MKVFIDIETLPTTNSKAISDIRASIKAPAQFKKQDSIDAWMKDNAEEAAASAVKATSFDALYGTIACICYAIEDEHPRSVDCRIGERAMLVEFYKQLALAVHHAKPSYDVRPMFIGHNVLGFDIPFLRQRSMILDAAPPVFVQNIYSARQHEDRLVRDTMLMWNSDKQKRVSMDKLCRAFGIEGKGEFDGSMVADTWPVNPEKVIQYCKDDVERTRQIYRRMTYDTI